VANFHAHGPKNRMSGGRAEYGMGNNSITYRGGWLWGGGEGGGKGKVVVNETKVRKFQRYPVRVHGVFRQSWGGLNE